MKRFLPAILFAAVLPGGASAQQDEYLDYQPFLRPVESMLGGCLDQAYNRETDLACQDLTMRACLAMGPQGDTTEGRVMCAWMLGDLWRARLDGAWTELLADTTPEEAERWRTEQGAWEAHRDAACAFEEARVEGGSMARHVGGECRIEMTADRLASFREVLRVR